MKHLLPLALFSTAGFLTVNAQDAPTTPPGIVSGWKLNGGDTVITFLFDGTFYFVDGSGARPGMERGTSLGMRSAERSPPRCCWTPMAMLDCPIPSVRLPFRSVVTR